MATPAAATTWEPPATIPKEDLVRTSDEVLGRPDIPLKVEETVFRINVLGMDWDIGGQVYEPSDPARAARWPDGRKIGLFVLHGGASDHRTRDVMARITAGKFGWKVVTMTFPGKLNLRDPNRDWPGDTINPDGTVRTPLWQVDEEITPDQYELIQDRSDPAKRAKWGTLFFLRAREGTRFYDRMAAWPIAFEEAMLEMCRRHLGAADGYAALVHGHSTGGPFVHLLLQRAENVVGLAGLESSQWGAVGASAGHQWTFPFSYLTIRTWRHIAKYLGPEAGLEGANRLPWLMEEVLEAWDRARTQPQFKAEYFVTFAALEPLEDAARVTARRLELGDAETEALVRRYHDLTRPLSGPGTKPVPPLLYIIAKNSVDHKLERYKSVLLPNLARLEPPPRASVVLLEAGIHAYDRAEEGLPRGVFPAAAQLWDDAVRHGYYLPN